MVFRVFFRFWDHIYVTSKERHYWDNKITVLVRRHEMQSLGKQFLHFSDYNNAISPYEPEHDILFKILALLQNKKAFSVNFTNIW